MMNSNVGGNDAAHDGGGLYLTNSSILTGTNAARIGQNGYPNSARYGGGAYLDGSRLTFAGSIAQNIASERGGGIAALNSSTLTVAGATLHKNTATGYGGGIYAHDSTLTMDHTHMHRNTGERGGALFQGGTNAVADLRNTLIYSNTVTAPYGAGVRSEGGAVTMTHATLAHNVNGAGYSQSQTQGLALNSIAWGNESGGFWVTSGNLTGACSLDQSFNAGPNLDPQFVLPGHGEDYHLVPGSPAIDRCATGLPNDLDMAARPIGTNYDAGAYEYPHAVTLTPNRTSTQAPGAVAHYNHTLTNLGTTADTYELTIHSDLGWSVTSPSGPTVTLNAGESTSIAVNVTVPTGVLSGTVDTTRITATSTTHSGLSAQATDTTSVSAIPGFTFTPAHESEEVSADQTYLYERWLTNTGNYTDTFDLSITSSQGWSSLTDPSPRVLPMGASMPITISVTIPPHSNGQSEICVVTASSHASGGSADAQLTVTVEGTMVYLPLVQKGP
jgi:predicted outer membrane repeat protein